MSAGGGWRRPLVLGVLALLAVTACGCSGNEGAHGGAAQPRAASDADRRWHTVYTRMNRWAKNGVLARVFEHVQREQIVRVKLDAV